MLDEPTSALDPTAAEEVLAAITRLVHDLGVTVVMAEHRLERVVQYADSIVHLPGDGTLEYGDPPELLARSSVAPPIVELGRAARWTPLPLSVRDARRRAAPLSARLASRRRRPFRRPFLRRAARGPALGPGASSCATDRSWPYATSTSIGTRARSSR